MERALALKTLTKMLGKSLGYRVDPSAPTHEDREAAKLDLTSAVEEKNRLKQLKEARFNAILEADTEYQALRSAFKVAEERVSKLHGILHHYKFTVGSSNGMFFMVKAQGDSWEEVIAKLKNGKD